MTNQTSYSSYGKKLKQARQSQKLSKAEVARKLQITTDQISAIENGGAKAWEGAYSLGYVDGYRRLLGVRQFKFASAQKQEKPNKLEALSENSFTISKLLSAGLVTMIVLGIVGYVFWQVLTLTSPPPLKLYNLSNYTVTDETTIKISGKTTENTDVSINGQSILTEPDGSFSADIPLKPGVNELSVTATNRLTKQSMVKTTIIADYQIDSIKKKQ